jgi:hypothetical protein
MGLCAVNEKNNAATTNLSEPCWSIPQLPSKEMPMKYAITIVAALIILPVVRSLCLPRRHSNVWNPYNDDH